MLNTYEAFTGERASNIALQAYGQAKKHGSLFQYIMETAKPVDPRVGVYRNSAELEKRLVEAKRTDAYPLLFVQPGHLTTVNSYNTVSKSASYDNQWGKENDGGVSVNSLKMLGDKLYRFDKSHK